MQALSALGNAPVVDLQAPTGDGLNSTQHDEILEVNQMRKIVILSLMNETIASARSSQ
jgi:hypothetical protein